MQVMERRHWIRVQPRNTLLASLDGSRAAEVLNLGPTGAMIEHTSRLSPGETCTLFLCPPGLAMRIQARVAWSQIYNTTRTLPGQGKLRFRSGLAFLPLPEGAQGQLRHILGALGSTTPQPSPEVGSVFPSST